MHIRTYACGNAWIRTRSLQVRCRGSLSRQIYAEKDQGQKNPFELGAGFDKDRDLSVVLRFPVVFFSFGDDDALCFLPLVCVSFSLQLPP